MNKREIRVRIAYVGPAGSGKTATVEYLHRSFAPERRSQLFQLTDRGSRTLLYDYAEFSLGRVGEIPLYADVYALSGSPAAVLARRMILSGCDGFVFVADGRDAHLSETRVGFRELLDLLGDRRKSIDDTALFVQLTHDDLVRGVEGEVVRETLARQVGAERIVRVNTREPTTALEELFRKVVARVLSLEHKTLEARRMGLPPLRYPISPKLEREIEFAHKLYLRATQQLGAKFSPHSDAFFGQVLLELGALEPQQLEEALKLRAETVKLNLGVSLSEILIKKELVTERDLRRATRLRAHVEVIHEDLLFGRLAHELSVVPFERIKQALVLQAKRHFQHALDHLLTRAGHLTREGRWKVLRRQVQMHTGELLRDEQDLVPLGIQEAPSRLNEAMPLFGEVALRLGFVTLEQLEECLEEQAQEREDGRQRFIGSLLRLKGYLDEDAVKEVCKALEEQIADDRIDGYTIQRYLGRGNMALVYAARQNNLDRMVALKVLDPKLLFDDDFIVRFSSEARAAARLNHPNIVQAYDVGTCQDLHYFVMEYVDGVTARDMMEQNGGKLDEDLAVDIVVQVARALDHAARHNLVHRDVKPGNVMITRDGVIKLCDLGLAKVLDSESTVEDTAILGSPYYIAPEQVQGIPDIDIRADIYSLGATFFQMVTGRPPFLGRTPEEVCLKHLSEPVPDPQMFGSATQRLTPIIFRMMSKDRDKRFSNCQQLVASLLEVRPEAASEDHREALAKRVQEAFPPIAFAESDPNASTG